MAANSASDLPVAVRRDPRKKSGPITLSAAYLQREPPATARLLKSVNKEINAGLNPSTSDGLLALEIVAKGLPYMDP
ncbi:hypothetical protein SLEP1_g29540 [Rubroshorea leprosula]|uniref:Uncharacterized protein n=1 Tax=Rubroshorea leprosula TaxID=152421 RepID=A0AAV5JX61_9ROSI|nr:hypothetical protein SLEP1_g29540 [Rubroshorea leprosula]